MNRRGFMGSILALGAAPAIVRADALMRIVPRDTSLILRTDDSWVRTAVNFGDLTAQQKELWSREMWRAAHRQSYIGIFST